MLLASVIGGYTLIGGLGATFYVSYFNTALIFVLILMLVIEVFYNPSQNPDNPFGSSDDIYEFISCWRSPQEEGGNRGGSYLTFFSPGGLIFGIVNIVGNFGTVFCDQCACSGSKVRGEVEGRRARVSSKKVQKSEIMRGTAGRRKKRPTTNPP